MPETTTDNPKAQAPVEAKSVQTPQSKMLEVLNDAYLNAGDRSYTRQAMQPVSYYPEFDNEAGVYSSPATQVYKLHQEIRDKSPEIYGRLEQRRDAVLALKRRLVPYDTTEEDTRVHEFVEAALDGIGGNGGGFAGDLKNMLRSVFNGLSIMEIDWQPVSEIRKNVLATRAKKTDSVSVGDGILAGNWVVPVNLKDRFPAAFRFNRDGVLHIPGEKSGFVPAPAMKFITLIGDSDYENPYGTGLLHRLQWTYKFKKQCLTSWLVALDKFGTPTTVIKYGSGATDEEKAAIDNVLERIATDTGVSIPESLSIDFKEASSGANVGQAFQALMDYLDSCASICILGSTLTSSEGQHGTQALGAVHAAVAANKIEEDARILMWAVNKSLIRWIVDINFGTKTPAPVWVIDTAEDTREADMKAADMLIKMGVPVPLEWLYKCAGAEAPQEGDMVIEGARRVAFSADPPEPAALTPAPAAAPQEKPAPPSGAFSDFQEFMSYLQSGEGR
ncbi:TPA: hypothetical protein DDW35_11200 [Candidatus Sumerlaeota bacterium]|nr:hypothetical protein [Candidatus Sumerlaeota bacterium]